MTPLMALATALSAGLLIYLGYALLWPERLS